jgi:hypothetical protein
MLPNFPLANRGRRTDWTRLISFLSRTSTSVSVQNESLQDQPLFAILYIAFIGEMTDIPSTLTQDRDPPKRSWDGITQRHDTEQRSLSVVKN